MECMNKDDGSLHFQAEICQGQIYQGSAKIARFYVQRDLGCEWLFPSEAIV